MSLEGFEISIHARQRMDRRDIPEEWIERAIVSPDRIETHDDETTHFIISISEHWGGYLRVVVNQNKMPKRIVTAFFDRRLGRKVK